MTKKQFYYLVCIIKELFFAAFGCGMYLFLESSKENEVDWIVLGIIVVVGISVHFRVRSYIKKAFDIKNPDVKEQKDLEKLEK